MQSLIYHFVAIFFLFRTQQKKPFLMIFACVGGATASANRRYLMT